MNGIKFKKIATLFISVILSVGVWASDTLQSPNEQLKINFELKALDELENRPVYSVSFRGEPLIENSPLGLTLADGSSLTGSFKRLSAEKSSYDKTWKPVYGEQSVIRNNYNELVVNLSHENAPQCHMDVVFRCYNTGIAIRYRFPENALAGDSIAIKQEKTEFRFLDNHRVWLTYRPQRPHKKKKLRRMGSGASRPVTIKVNDTTFAALTEAALVDYARARLSRSDDDPFGVMTELDSEVSAQLPMETPWRVLMIASGPGELLENNELILNLNEPGQIDYTTWIKPGKAMREVTNSTVGAKSCINFAANHNLDYIEFDTGWYGSEFDTAANPMTVASGRVRKYPNQDVFMEVNLDLMEVSQYARHRGIGIILYVNHVALENYSLDSIFSTYQRWGIAGVKFGFVNVGSQKWTKWLHQAIRKAAKYELMVDVHDEYRPTGYSRTYPNLMTQEGIYGDEGTPSSKQDLITLFTRMLAGAGDHTICYFAKRVYENWTHAHQLAKAVCFYSPLQFLYWYDRPRRSPDEPLGEAGEKTVIGDEPELEFYDHVPTVWDETRVTHAQIGEYAVIARRSGREWYIGAMNNKKERSLKLPLDFLSPDKKYVAHIYYDDPTVNTRTRVGIQRNMVDSNTTIDIKLLANGGQAIRIVPAEPEDDYPPYAK